MTWLNFITGLVRTRIMNQVTQDLLTDWDTNGLSAEDITIIDSYLAQTKP